MDPQAAQTTAPGGSGAKKILVYLVIFLVLIVIIGVGFLLLRGEPKEPGPKVVTDLERDSITIGKIVFISGVFPESEPDFFDVVFNNNIFDGLGRIVDGEVKPALATSWTNPDNTTWIFKLRKGVKFHNGDSFTAADVKFSIDQALKNDWPNSFNLSTVKSVEVVDDFTVIIKTTSPDPVLLNRLVFAFIVSEKQFKEKSAEAVGTGPYKFISLDKEKAVLEANDDYYLGAPKVKKVVYKFFSEDTKAEKLVEALNNGEVDLISIDEADVAKSAKGEFQIKSLTDPFISFLWLDTSRDKSPYVDKTPNPLKNKLVRQAIYKAINISSVIKESKISAVPASQFVTNAIFGFNPNITRPETSIEEAKNLMKQAGVSGGFKLTLDSVVGREAEANAIAKDLEKINIKVKVNEVGVDKVFEKIIVGKDSSAFILDYGAETFDAGEIFTNVLHTQTGSFGSDNLTGFSNSKIDKLAEEIATIFESKSRQAKMQEAMTIALEELPFIPLYNKEFFYLISNNFDWTPTAFGAIYVNEISGREVRTQ